jgi:hypothetical protein
MNHHRSQLDDKRRKVIKAMLKLYSVDDLCSAITGCSLSPWHMGKNERKQRYDALDLVLRDASHVDRFMAMKRDPPDASSRHNGFADIDYEFGVENGKF